jgi:hypothetical protein
MKPHLAFLTIGSVTLATSALAQNKPAQGKETLQEQATTIVWKTVDQHPFKLRRSFDDLLDPDSRAAKGAQISYSNDFNAQSAQWGFHGIVGYNWHRRKGFADPNAPRQDDSDENRGLVDYRILPSVQWDKIDTSNGDADELDALIFRLTEGFRYVSKEKDSFIDGWRVNLSASYATDSDFNSGIAAGELDIKPFKTKWGLNSRFPEAGIFRIRPELFLHVEGGTVTNDGAITSLVEQDDFFRVGGKAGLSIRFDQNKLPALKGLLLQVNFQYYVDVTDNGPDVDLFTASADWALDEKDRVTLSIEYRNGRAPLVLERDNRLTVGLGVKF